MKTFSIPFYKDMEFAFTTDTYASVFLRKGR